MSLPRFHLPAASWSPPLLSLTEDEAAHCGRVMRKEPGDRIEIFDGEGRVTVCVITQVTKSTVQAQIESESNVSPFPTAIHLLPALIKNEPFEWLLEKAVELGAASIQPIVTERTVVHLDGAQAEKKLSKWRRHMIESAKQCHTPFVPRLQAPKAISAVLESMPENGLKLIPALSEPSRALKHILPEKLPSDVFVLIGPEGDFTPAEEILAQKAGFAPVTLGPLILRAETAAICVLSVLRSASLD
jgi:16S rRNA (uracil1498-N3)-methyltransferase